MIFRNLGNGKFEELIEEAGPAIAAPHSQPRLRVRRFRQRWRHGRSDHEPERAAVAAAQRSRYPARHWLKVKLIGVKSNRSAIGARVTVSYGGKLQAQEVLSSVELLIRSTTSGCISDWAAPARRI